MNKYTVFMHFDYIFMRFYTFIHNIMYKNKFFRYKCIDKKMAEKLSPPFNDYLTAETVTISSFASLSTVNVIVSPALRITILSASFTATL